MLYNSPEEDRQESIIEDDPELNRIKDDVRHRDRMAILQALYMDEFGEQSWDDLDLIECDQELLAQIRAHKAEYDEAIQAVATERPVHDLAKIDLAILRLILHERATKKTPVKVLIDEGVELAKDFGAENAYAFVNAVLEKILMPDGKQAVANSENDDKSQKNTENVDENSSNSKKHEENTKDSLEQTKEPAEK